MNTFQAIVLGLLQGLTEFLPVSSSGHLEIGKAWFGLEDLPLTFSILVHGATAMSTVVVFWPDIRGLVRGLADPRTAQQRKYVAFLLLSMIPAGIVGFTLRDFLEAAFIDQTHRVGLTLWVTAAILFVSQRFAKRNKPITAGKAFGIGLAQAFAILPGVSRSGSTIGAAIAMGISREEAARFSFLMALPVILGATALEVKDLVEVGGVAGGSDLVLPYAVGTIVAFISGILACKWMIRLVQNTSLNGFAVYCAILGTIVLITL